MGIMGPKNIDLKRKVKFKVRKQDKTTIANRQVFRGRTYAGFRALDLTPFDYKEMDTVLSAKGSPKCILTFFFPDTHLFLAYLLPRRTEGAVQSVFDRLEKTLGTFDFHCLFPVILTDRGSEFGDPEALETGIDDFHRTDIYYCDPMCSGQKGGLEEAHTLLRMVLPKKTVFTDLTQWDLRKIVNHINSYPRQCLNGSTPYEESLNTYGPELLKKMQLKPIPPDEVTLTPKLLKK